MKSLVQYITEKRGDIIVDFKWSEKDWNLLQSIIDKVKENKEDIKKVVKYFCGRLENNCDTYLLILKKGEFGYWKKDELDKFSLSWVESYMLDDFTKLFNFSEEHKDFLTKEEKDFVKSTLDTISKYMKENPEGETLGKNEVKKILDKIVKKYKGLKLEEFDTFYSINYYNLTNDYSNVKKFRSELDNEFDKYENHITGDGQMYSIYVSF